MKTSLKVTYLVCACCFALFAFFQINDIDPAIYNEPSVIDAALWFLFYAFVSVLFILRLKGKRIPVRIFILAILACAAEFGRTFAGVYSNLFESEQFTLTGSQMSAARPEVELSREFFGAVIVLGALFFLMWAQKKSGAKVKAS